MIILIITLNILGIFVFAGSLKKFQDKIPNQHSNKQVKYYYKIISVLLIFCSFILCHLCWRKIGWIIGVNLTSINALAVTIMISYFPQFFLKWNDKFQSIFDS